MAGAFLTVALLASVLAAGCNRGGDESAATGTPAASTVSPEAQAQMRSAQQADAASRAARAGSAPKQP
jgi:hypothetical protein